MVVKPVYAGIRAEVRGFLRSKTTGRSFLYQLIYRAVFDHCVLPPPLKVGYSGLRISGQTAPERRREISQSLLDAKEFELSRRSSSRCRSNYQLPYEFLQLCP